MPELSRENFHTIPVRVTSNVSRVLSTLQEDETLVKELHSVLNKVYEKAGVRLTQMEKAAFMKELGDEIGRCSAVVAWV